MCNEKGQLRSIFLDASAMAVPVLTFLLIKNKINYFYLYTLVMCTYERNGGSRGGNSAFFVNCRN